MSGLLERNQRDLDAKLFPELAVHLVLGDPQRQDRDFDGEIVDLDAE